MPPAPTPFPSHTPPTQCAIDEADYSHTLYVMTLLPIGVVLLSLLSRAALIAACGGKMMRGMVMKGMFLFLFLILPMTSTVSQI